VTPGAEQLVEAIGRWRADRFEPLVVAIDGYGGSGKTTITTEASIAVEATVIHTDTFFEDGPPTEDPRPMSRYYRWSELRSGSLEPAIRDRLPLILVEGVSSAAPALGDLVTRAVFVATPESVRLARLHERLTDEEWDEHWLTEERVYFASRPPESFDLIVPGSAETSEALRILG